MENSQQDPKLVYRNAIMALSNVRVIVEAYEDGSVQMNIELPSVGLCGLLFEEAEFAELVRKLAEAKQSIDGLNGEFLIPVEFDFDKLPPDTLIGDIMRRIEEQDVEPATNSTGICEQGGECSYDFSSPYLTCKKCGKSLF